MGGRQRGSIKDIKKTDSATYRSNELGAAVVDAHIVSYCLVAFFPSGGIIFVITLSDFPLFSALFSAYLRQPQTMCGVWCPATYVILYV